MTKPVPESRRSRRKMPSGSPLRSVTGPRRKRPRCVQSVLTSQRCVPLRRTALTTRLALCQGSVEKSSISSQSLGSKVRLVTSNCSSTYWPTWLRRERVRRRAVTPRTLFHAQPVAEHDDAGEQVGQAEGQVAPGVEGQ